MSDPQKSTERVRTHLANERTFLAWFRTGLTCMALGLASAQLLDEGSVLGLPVSSTLAVMLTVFGFVLIALGRVRYRQAAMGINEGTFRSHRRGLDVAIIGGGIVMVVALVFILRFAR